MLVRRKKVLLATFATVSILVVVWLFVRKSAPPEPKPRTAEDILNERERLAGQLLLEQPLAKTLLAKDWENLKKAFVPARDGRALADVIRAFHIQSKMAVFTPPEKDELLRLLLLAIESRDPKGLPDPLVVAQVERLPEAKSNGEADKLLTKWLQRDGGVIEKKWLAVRKLAGQRLQPKKPALEILRSALYRPDGAESEKAWTTLDQMRNVDARQRLMEEALNRFSRIPDGQQGRALAILAGGLQPTPSLFPKVKAVTLKLLKSGPTDKIEGALRGIDWLSRAGALSPAEQGEIVRGLTAIPDSDRTPFIQAKSEEIIHVFQP
jgi:hypothetical protein